MSFSLEKPTPMLEYPAPENLSNKLELGLVLTPPEILFWNENKKQTKTKTALPKRGLRKTKQNKTSQTVADGSIELCLLSPSHCRWQEVLSSALSGPATKAPLELLFIASLLFPLRFLTLPLSFPFSPQGAPENRNHVLSIIHPQLLIMVPFW